MERAIKPGYLRPSGAAKYLDVSQRCIRDWQRDSILPFYKLGKRCVLFKVSDLDAAIAKFKTK
jgi:excisionase family DNA binding protein